MARLFLTGALRHAVERAFEFTQDGQLELVRRLCADISVLTAGAGAEVLRSVIAGALLGRC